MELTKAAINRPVFIFMLMLAAIGVGLLSFYTMRVELNPEVNFGAVTVSTTYPGAGPEEINNLISRKIEEAVSGVAGVREVTSTSVEGQSTVVVSLELEVDTNVALNDVRSKVDAITGNLPKDALKPQVTKFDASSAPVLNLSLTSKTLDSRALRTLVDDKIADRFGQINGVAAASVSGGDVREIQIQVKKDALLAYGIGIADVQQAVAGATLNAPSGKLVSGDREYSVRVLGEFKDSDEIRNMVFTVRDVSSPNAKPKTVHLSDVATIIDGSAERTAYSRLNGTDTVAITIQKTKEGNAVEITKGVDAVIKQLQEQYKDLGLSFVKTNETGKQITESLDDVTFALEFGIFLVALIVYIFLHNFRGTLIVALAIPTCIFASFIAMKMLGFTINNMTMLAMSLAIGVLVDDAIVVLENISRHLRLGEDPKEAALNGRGEIGLAAIAITLADVVVFLPVGTMGGIVGQFFKPMALGFVCAVLFSLFVSFTLTPMLASRWYRAGEDLEHVTGAFAVWFEKMFHRVETFYARQLEWALNHRWFVFISGNIALVAVFMFIAGGFAGSVTKAIPMGIPLLGISTIIGLIVFVVNIFRKHVKLKFILYGFLFGLVFPASAAIGGAYATWKKEAVFKFGFLPSSDSGNVTVSVELPTGSSLEQTGKVVEQVEKIVLKNPEAKNVFSNVGFQGGGFGGGGNTGSNYAQISVQLNDKASAMDTLRHSGEKLRHVSSDSVAADLLLAIGKIPGTKIKVSAQDSFGFGAPIQMSFASDNRELLVATVGKIRDELQKGVVPGVINPDLSSKPGKPEIQAIPNRLAMADAGIDLSTLGPAMRDLYNGNNDTKLRVRGREFGIRVMMDLKDRNNPDLLNQVPITFKSGNPVYLSQVADTQVKPALDKIERRQRVEEIRITADLLPGSAVGTVQQQINTWMADKHLIPEGVIYKPLGQADSQAREGVFLFSALGIGLVLVYMLLASLFDNMLYPFIIQLAQPQAMVGALLALVLTDKSLNLVGFIGLICLVGLVGKNAILLVDYTNTLRGDGLNRHDALVKAGPTRLRPIAMTTLALILGMLPVALAIGRGSEFRETIGITIIGGISPCSLFRVLTRSSTISATRSGGFLGSCAGKLKRLRSSR